MILIFTMLHFKKIIIKKNSCRYHYQNLDDIIYSPWDIEQNILKLVILGHFCPFTPKNPKNQNSEKWRNLLEISSFYKCVPKITIIWSYDVRFLRHVATQTEISAIFSQFLLFQPSDNQENQNFKIQKPPGDIIILHICTITDNHMMYGPWDIERDRHNFLSFWAIFLHFYPPKNLKNQNFEKIKKVLAILSLYTCVQ